MYNLRDVTISPHAMVEILTSYVMNKKMTACIQIRSSKKTLKLKNQIPLNNLQSSKTTFKIKESNMKNLINNLTRHPTFGS